MKLTGYRLSTNPIFVRLYGHNRWIPPVFVFILIPIVQSILTTFLSIPYLSRSVSDPPIVRIMLIGWLIVFIAPAVIALAAMMIVAKHSASKDYQLLMLTNIPASSRVNGYAAGVLYRMRLFLVMLAVILPWLATGMVIVPLARKAVTYLMICPSNDVRCAPSIAPGISPSSIVVGAVLVHLMVWGLILLAANTGMMFGLRWRHNLSISSLAGACVLLIDAAVIYGWIMEEWMRVNPGIVGIQPLQAGICVGVFALTFGIKQLAKRWV